MVCTALGATPRQVLWMFLLESFMLGLMSTVTGALLGTAVAAGLNALHVPVPQGLQFFLMSPHLHLSVHGSLLGVAAIAVLSNGLVHARQPREVAGLLTGVLLILALGISTLPKLLATLRARRQALPENIQSTTAGKTGRMKT